MYELSIYIKMLVMIACLSYLVVTLVAVGGTHGARTRCSARASQLTYERIHIYNIIVSIIVSKTFLIHTARVACMYTHY